MIKLVRTNIPDTTRSWFPREAAEFVGVHFDLDQVISQGQEGCQRIHRRKEKNAYKKGEISQSK